MLILDGTGHYYAVLTEDGITHGILLRQAMATLSPEVRQAIEWFYLEGFSQKEIAGLWRVPQTTVKGGLEAGRLRLRKEFQKLELLSAEVIEEAVAESRVALTDADPRETKALRAAFKAVGLLCSVIKQEDLLLPRLYRLKPDLSGASCFRHERILKRVGHPDW